MSRAIFLKTKIVGTQFRGISAQVRLNQLRDNEMLALERETHNPYDRNAVAVYSVEDEGRDGTHLGYVPKSKNIELARQMDEGIQVVGFWEEDNEVVRIEAVPEVTEN